MVSIIILSYNTCDITLKCLSHLTKSKNVDLEIIVIDNASTDGSVPAIAKKFPQVKLVANKDNIGFAAGNNQGMELAKGEVILLLNSDCFVQPDTLASCVRYLDQFDVLGCRLINQDKSTQYSWGYFPTLGRIFLLMTFVDNFPLIRMFIKSIHVRDLSRYNLSQEVDWITGAFVMFNKEVFKKVGGIDEKYFMYGEEMEWMYRIKKAGFKVRYVSEAQATHLLGASTKSLSQAFASEMKGYLYWFTKHNPSWQLPILKLILVVGTFYKALAWNILGGILGKPTLGRDNWKTFKSVVNSSFVYTEKQTT